MKMKPGVMVFGPAETYCRIFAGFGGDVITSVIRMSAVESNRKLIHLEIDPDKDVNSLREIVRKASDLGLDVSLGISCDDENFIIETADLRKIAGRSYVWLSRNGTDIYQLIDAISAHGGLSALTVGFLVSGHGVCFYDGKIIDVLPFIYPNARPCPEMSQVIGSVMDFNLAENSDIEDVFIRTALSVRSVREDPGQMGVRLSEDAIEATAGQYECSRLVSGNCITYVPELPEVKAVMLDLDGLMALTEELQNEAFNILMRRKGFNGFSLSPEEEAFFVGRDEYEDCDYLRREYGLDDPLDEIVAERKAIYLDLVKERGIQPGVGLPEIMETARRQGLKMVVVTNSPSDDVEIVLGSLLDGMGIAESPERFFDGVVTFSMVERGKPFPDIYELACEIAQVNPRNCVAFEDSGSGIRSARSAGIMRAIAVPNEYTENHDFSEAFAVIPNLNEGVKFISR